jgi:sugar/nucleoside kinase (ribokinase family)
MIDRAASVVISLGSLNVDCRASRRRTPCAEASRAAVAAAKIAVTRAGTTSSYPDADELDALIENVTVGPI